jgi:hypothetical protein
MPKDARHFGESEHFSAGFESQLGLRDRPAVLTHGQEGRELVGEHLATCDSAPREHNVLVRAIV